LKQNIDTRLFLLSLENNKRVQLGSLLSKQTTVINFGSIHCVPCKEEISELVKLKSELINVQFLFINTDMSSDKKEVLIQEDTDRLLSVQITLPEIKYK
jgi:thiol-disulfide isomerase/thioredoxin